jgi:hypothetical protein
MSMTKDEQKVARVDLDSVQDIQPEMTAIKRNNLNNVILEGNSEKYQAEIQDLARSGFNVVVSDGTKAEMEVRSDVHVL